MSLRWLTPFLDDTGRCTCVPLWSASNTLSSVNSAGTRALPSSPTLYAVSKLTMERKQKILESERLATQSDWTRELKDFAERLQCIGDDKYMFIAPPKTFEGARANWCFLNVRDFCRVHKDYVPVVGFKINVMPTFGLSFSETPYVAVAHVVARHMETGKYRDVTPSEDGERQKMLFVPSSLLYPEWQVEKMATYSDLGFRVRMGGVCNGYALQFKQDNISSDLYKATVQELKLMFCPELGTVRGHLGMPLDSVKTLLVSLDATICVVRNTEYAIVDATKYRDAFTANELYKATVKELKLCSTPSHVEA